MSDQSVPNQNGQLPGLSTRPPAGLEPIQLEQLAPGFGRRRPLSGAGQAPPANEEPPADDVTQYEQAAAVAVHEPAPPAAGPPEDPIPADQAPPPAEAQTPPWSPAPERPAPAGLAFGGGMAAAPPSPPSGAQPPAPAAPPPAHEPTPPQQPPPQQPPPATQDVAPPPAESQAPITVEVPQPFPAQGTSPEIPSQRPPAQEQPVWDGAGEGATADRQQLEQALVQGVPAALAVDLCRLAVRHDVSLADLRKALEKLG